MTTIKILVLAFDQEMGDKLTLALLAKDYEIGRDFLIVYSEVDVEELVVQGKDQLVVFCGHIPAVPEGLRSLAVRFQQKNSRLKVIYYPFRHRLVPTWGQQGIFVREKIDGGVSLYNLLAVLHEFHLSTLVPA